MFCNSELRGFDQQLDEFRSRGIQVAAISADSPAEVREHAAKTGWKLQLLADPEVKAIDAYGLKHQVSPKQAISRPAELLVDPTGTVRWVDLTDDLRVRTRPETVLEAFDRLQAPENPQ